MPTVTLPSPSTRAHSWDLRNFRSPGISLIVGSGSAGREGVDSVSKHGGYGSSAWRSDAVLHPALTDERALHQAHRHFAAADVDPHIAGGAGGNAREGDRLADGRGKGAGQDLAFARDGQHLLAMAQHALVVHHQADHLSRGAVGVLAFERLAANECARSGDRKST